MKLDNPLFAIDNNFIQFYGQQVSGEITLFIKFTSKHGSNIIVEQRETHKYKLSDENCCENKDHYLDLIDFSSTFMNSDTDMDINTDSISGTELYGTCIERLLQNTQLCLHKEHNDYKFILHGEINGSNINNIINYEDEVKVHGIVNLKIVNAK